MTEILYAGLVDVKKIGPLIAGCDFASNALFLAEQLPVRASIGPRERRDLLRFTYFNRDLPFTDYSSGRVFQRDAELRWQLQGDKMRVVYLGPQERASVLHEYGLREKHDQEKPEDLRKRDAYYYLFGERIRPPDLEKIGPQAKPGDFAEVRIPHLLRYPVPHDGKRYVRLAVREYVDPATDQVRLFRFQALETME
jgi:hypothetical protein